MGIRSSPKVQLSYVLPTHDRVEYLGECLLSLVEQTVRDCYEIIVVDDGSTDSTEEMVKCYVKEYPFVSYYKLPKKGVEYARNFGNQKAKAGIIGVCDSDDLYHPDRTKITIAYFNKHPKVDFMDGSYVEINHQGLVIRQYMARQLVPDEFFRGTGYVCHDNCAYRKKRILETPYRFSKGNTDDWNLVSDWLKKGYKFGFTPKELCKVRTLRKGIMGARRAERGIVLPYA